jgi:Peptidase inhibitor family I36
LNLHLDWQEGDVVKAYVMTSRKGATTMVRRINMPAVLLAGGAILGAAPIATAQRLGGPEPRSGACFYEDVNFRGDYFCLSAGSSLRALSPGMNDRISSIRVFGNAEVRIYEDFQFRGDSERYDDDVRTLGREWNDSISSIQVETGDRRRSSGNRDLGRGQDVDRIVRRAYEDILDRQPDQAGLRLYRSRMIDDGWTERQVRDALRNSPEYREKSTMTRAKAEQIVRDAYRAVLKRDPDPGAAAYVNHVLRDKWT